jgi:hypothetical protein
MVTGNASTLPGAGAQPDVMIVHHLSGEVSPSPVPLGGSLPTVRDDVTVPPQPSTE